MSFVWFYAGIHVISNSVIDQPWQKVPKGREKFEQILSRHRHRRYSAELKKDLIDMLSDCSRYKTVLRQLSLSVLRKLNYVFCCSCFCLSLFLLFNSG